MSIELGGKYRYRIGTFVMETKFEIVRRDGDYWVGQSYDSWESKWYFNDNGQQVGTEESGITGGSNVWLVL